MASDLKPQGKWSLDAGQPSCVILDLMGTNSAILRITNDGPGTIQIQRRGDPTFGNLNAGNSIEIEGKGITLNLLPASIPAKGWFW